VQEIRKRNEPQRTHRHVRGASRREVASRRVGHKERKKLKGFGAASQRNGMSRNSVATLREAALRLQSFEQ
jgi:hypothetical protein